MAAAQPARVLIVDDEEPLLQLMERFLASIGYDVDACLSGEAGWALFQRDPRRHVLAIIDLTLQDIDGGDLVRRMLAAAPALKALICSGYPVEMERFPPEQRARIGFLHKPFLPKMLVEAVEDLIRPKA